MYVYSVKPGIGLQKHIPSVLPTFPASTNNTLCGKSWLCVREVVARTSYWNRCSNRSGMGEEGMGGEDFAIHGVALAQRMLN